MAYENPSTFSPPLGSVSFATTTTRVIRLPRNRTGRIIDIGFYATVLFTNVTTGAKIQVGNGVTANFYGETPQLGALAAGASSNSGNAALTGVNVELPANTDITLTFLAPTGGAPAGTANPNVVIETY